MESPIPILPLPTPDAETEKLIRMKDEEVGGYREQGRGCGRGEGRRAEAERACLLTLTWVTPTTSCGECRRCCRR